MLQDALKNALGMFRPAVQLKNPVMFVTYIGAILTSFCVVKNGVHHPTFLFELQLALWLWFTVFFANFAEAIAESRGKAQAAGLKETKVMAYARLLVEGVEKKTPSDSLKKGDIILCKAGDIIPADGEVIEGVATVDESAITGESAPVIRESGGDLSAVTAGTKIISDALQIKVTSEAGNSFLDKMIKLIEGAKRQKTPSEVALNVVLAGLTLMFLLTTTSLKAFTEYSAGAGGEAAAAKVSVPILASLLVCLIPTTISALLGAVGIAGMDRLVLRNVIAKSGRAVEAAGDIDLLILDKTGTITIGNRMATRFVPAAGVSERELVTVAQLASLSDETPEGRSIVVLAKSEFGMRAESLQTVNSLFVPFSAATRMSGVDFKDEEGKVVRSIRKGSVDSVRAYVERLGGVFPEQLNHAIQNVGKQGGTPLLVSDNTKIMGIVELKDIIKGGIKEKFSDLRKMGIRTVMITGDNPLTAAAIAAESGVDDYIAEATPEIKLALIRKAQENGRLVAMTGDGTNDAPALAQADVAVAMNAGTQASREAGNMVDLDNNPAKLIDIVEIGKQMLMTRGALTTFSIANDVAKYFAILPAIFGMLYKDGAGHGPLAHFNLLGLHSEQSAILSAVIFNAMIIVMLIPLALRGVQYRPESADELLRRNVLIYGLGGVIAPFVGIKCIDLLISALGAAL